MTHDKLKMGKGSIIAVLFCTIHPSKNIRNNYLNMERVQRLKNAVVNRCKMKKIHQKYAGCTIFAHQDLCNGDALIKL